MEGHFDERNYVEQVLLQYGTASGSDRIRALNAQYNRNYDQLSLDPVATARGSVVTDDVAAACISKQ